MAKQVIKCYIVVVLNKRNQIMVFNRNRDAAMVLDNVLAHFQLSYSKIF